MDKFTIVDFSLCIFTGLIVGFSFICHLKIGAILLCVVILYHYWRKLVYDKLDKQE